MLRRRLTILFLALAAGVLIVGSLVLLYTGDQPLLVDDDLQLPPRVPIDADDNAYVQLQRAIALLQPGNPHDAADLCEVYEESSRDLDPVPSRADIDRFLSQNRAALAGRSCAAMQGLPGSRVHRLGRRRRRHLDPDAARGTVPPLEAPNAKAARDRTPR